MTIGQVEIDRSYAIMPQAWMAFDRNGELIAWGGLADETFEVPPSRDQRIRKFIVGVEVWEALMRASLPRP